MKMTMKKHLPVLLMILLPSVSTKKDVYCEVEETARYYHSVICRNASIQENELIRLSDEFQSNTFIDVTLISVFANVHNNTLQYFPRATILTISDSNINSFSLQSSIKQLNVFNSIFPRVTSDVLMGCKNLTEVFFMSNHGLQFDESPFQYLKNLQFLTILNQTIPKLQRSVFKELENLLSLCLVSDNIKEIEEDAFVDLSNLKILFLDGNPIETFNVNISSSRTLYILSLFNTNLKRLNFDVLSSAKQLMEIRLSRNILRDINATELATKVRRLKTVVILPWELQCPEVISLADQLKEEGIKVNAADVRASEFKNLIKPSVC